MKLTTDRPYTDPEKAARRLLEHAHAFEPIQEGQGRMSLNAKVQKDRHHSAAI